MATAGLGDVRAIALGGAAHSLRKTFGALDSGGLPLVGQAVALSLEE